jgi:acyl transferase domain-containing protein/acyl carrier protein
MSQSSSVFDRICQVVDDRLVRASSDASAPSEMLVPILADDTTLHDVLGALDIVIDAGSVGLVDPRQWGDRLPGKPESTPEIALLSTRQWSRYGKAKRSPTTAHQVMTMWRQRLQHLAGVAEDTTLLCLLGHSEPARSDAYMQDASYPISADAFIVLAGTVGLFCAEPPAFVKNADGVCSRALYCLSKREYAVRFARTTDIDALEQLEGLCWVPTLRTSRQRLLARIEEYPQGQFVLELGGEVKGVIYSQRIRDEADLGSCTMDDVHRLHDPDGDVVQLLAVNIDPGSQNLACGDQLLEFMLQRSCLQRGVRKVVAVTLCKDYSAGQGLSFEDYVAGPGRGRDRVLHFHLLHGAEIASTLPGYRPRDIANEGKGVLVKYGLARRRARAPARTTLEATAAEPQHAQALNRDEALRFVVDAVSILVDSAHAIDADRPLMESGLDSAGLLTLKTKLETRFGKRLKPSFFFSHNTPRKVIEYFSPDQRVSDRRAAGHAPAPARVAESAANPTDIAIIGVACRLPQGIDDLDALWEMLDAQRDIITEYPASRGEWPQGGGIERGGFLNEGECFDAPFFRISPSEAEVTDPQQRLLLEVSWACFEDACILPAALRGTDTGVFVGASNSDYAHLLQDAGTEVEAHSAVGNSLAVLANRLSYFYDFNGPSLLIDTACSASMVALHTAIQSLRARECGQALVGGVNFICNPRISLAYRKAGMLAPDGRCKVFDDSANGYVRSEGAVMLLLKPLREAVADRNRIHAVIRGSAVNHGGQAAGLTVPNPQRQATLLASAWRDARVCAQDISYIEAHGTGTSLGDPIEIEGMQSAFSATLPSGIATRCDVGSLKSNIGHMESAAGLAGVLKVIVSMEHRRLPASLHISTLNSRMNLQGSPLHVLSTARAWDAPSPRIAGVSSFGSGGANGHVVLQEYVPAQDDDIATAVCNAFPQGNLFVLSGVDETALRRNARAVLAWLHRQPGPQRFVDAVHTWQRARTAFKYRLALHVGDFDDLERKLKDWLDSGGPTNKSSRAASSGGGLGNDLAQWNDAVARQDWLTLARLWREGYEGEWSGLYDGMSPPPQLLKLPGYAFDRERYWVQLQWPVVQVMADGAGDEIVADTQYLQPVWEQHELPIPPNHVDPGGIETHVLICTGRELEEASLRLAMPACTLAFIDTAGDDAASRYAALASRSFAYVRTLLRGKGTDRIRLQMVADDGDAGEWVLGMRGMLKSASIEEPRLEWQIVSLRENTALDEMQFRIRANLRAFENESSVRYDQAGRFVRRWEAVQAAKTQNFARPLRAGGAYLITGGLGGLGRLFAGHILETVPDARVIVTGRAEAQVIDGDLAPWASTSRVMYRQLPLDRREDVEALVATLLDQGISLRGILHCAGQIADSYVVNKTDEAFAGVLAPKLLGTLHLDEATKDLDLDFFMLFSSIMAESGNAGQADYACANGFMDRYAAYRNGLAAKGLRRGHSVAIDWPLWRDGGMQIDTSALALLRETRGMAPMPVAVGLDCFRSGIWRGVDQLLILHGDTDRLITELAVGASHAPAASADDDGSELHVAVRDALCELVSAKLKLPAGKLDAEEDVARYGIDSIFVNKVNLALSRHFRTLSKTLFFQYNTINEIADYLSRHHAEECRTWTAGSASAVSAPLRTALTAAEPRSVNARSVARQNDGAIAIIGMSGVFPQARDLDEYWRNLAAGKDCVTEVPEVRWDLGAFYEPDIQRALAEGKSYCRHGAFIDGFAQFDPMFFGISPREAANIDPHERLFLQEAWRAMEDAGYSSDELRRRHRRNVGVFVGVTKTEFELNGAQDPAAAGRWYPRTSFSSIANRLSFFLDLSGPSMPVDTMCSSSLTAIHHACQQLRSGACEAAFVGGVNLYLHPSSYYYLSSLRMLASDGRCRSFGEGGSGFVPGEGAAVVLLKPLDRAIADGDPVHGVILSSQVNHGGRTNGFMVPNPRAQASVVREAFDKAGVNARHVSYIEAHGTGTALGDPIEVDGLQQAFAADTVDRQFCALGSAKSNIGHLEAAAGIAGLMKVVLQMRHQQLAPTLHVTSTNPNIHFESTSFAINRELRPWLQPVIDGLTVPRIAGVSSFGAGGVNAHVLLREPAQAVRADASEAASTSATSVLIPLSALRREQLVARAQQLLDVIDVSNSHDGRCDLQRLAYTLQTGRDAMSHRLAFAVDSLDALRAGLEAFLHGRSGAAIHVGGSDDRNERRDRRAHEVDACFAVADRIDVDRLAALWADGASVDWHRLYRTASLPQRMRLPTYPFATETYWRARLAPAGATDDARSALKAPLTVQHVLPDAADGSDVLLAIPVWRPLDNAQGTETAFERHVVLLCDVDTQAEALASALRDGAPGHVDLRCIALSASGADPAARYRSIALQCFEQLRALARDPSSAKTLVQCVIPDGDEWQTYRGLSALLRTVAMEKSRIAGQVIGVETGLDAQTLALRLRAIALRPRTSLLRYRDQRLEALDWQRLPSGADVDSVYKNAGVYVITGGLGALARLFVENIADHCSHATVVLTGRSPQTDAVARQVAGLERARTRVTYRQLDLQDAAAVSALFDDLRARHGTVNGIFHCAGMIADSLIVNKRSEDFEATLQPKVGGLWHLDNASRDLDLDFFVVFSSIASAMGSIGQTDYAAANGFMDHFIHHRRALERRGERRGVSVSINWPYWRDGGMQIDAATRTVLEQSIGMQPMATDVGLSALHFAIHADCAQMVVAQGDTDKLLARLRGEAVAEAIAPMAPPDAAAHHLAIERLSIDTIQKELRRMLAGVLHARPEDIALRKPLVELGLDSVLGTEFVSAINRRFSATLSTVGIYDYPNVMALAEYLEAAQPKASAQPLVIRASAFRDAVFESQPAHAAGSRVTDDRIAVVGMSGRYPQAGDLDAYWRNLVEARNAIVEIPDSRWDIGAYYDPDPDAEGKMYTRSIGLLDDVDAFDPRFFRITPQEALYMDPEQRLFLQESYRALEDAGYIGGDADGLNCGVYLGMESSEYAWQFANSPRVSETITGNHSAIAASRIAYFLNLKGPALAVDTACSSSLVATHLACQALRVGEIDLALAGGVRLWLSPVTHIGMCKARMLSLSGQCRTFDDSADGIVMGEGVGAVVLKRLADAVRDGDHIHGVILASGINQDGRTNGITAPSVKSQIALETRVYRDHGINPESISYIEAHGTGTKLGDPIELQALDTVFKERTQRVGFCALGSVKTNIGHTAAASGVASLHKVLLCLKHRRLVPTLNVDTPNRHFDFERSPFYINRENKDWQPALGGTRRACVSSFGFSGTNAHLVLEEYRPPAHVVDAAVASDERLIALSARNAAQLQRKARDLLAFVEREAPSGEGAAAASFLLSLAYTLQVGRAAMEERAAFTARTLDDLKTGLRTLGGEQTTDPVGVQRARVVEDNEFVSLWNTDEDLRSTAKKWLQECRLAKLLSLWIKGVDIDWRRLYGASPPMRSSLPTYPFAEDRYWIDRRTQDVDAHAVDIHGVDTYAIDMRARSLTTRLHPLIHSNISDLRRQAYRTTLSASAFYLDDHRVNGARVLPGVAYLEMARAALALAWSVDETHMLEFHDHTWIQPVVVDGDVELTVVLRDNGGGDDGDLWIDYEIVSESGQSSTLHCQGSVRYGTNAVESEPVDLAALDDAIDGAIRDRTGLYERFEALGLRYGPSMQGIAELRTDGNEVLARLRLPDAADPAFGLHPCMMDAAMQCTICLLAGFDSVDAAAAMPFSFEDMRVYGGTTAEMWAWVRRAPGAAVKGMSTLDINLINADGIPCVSIRGLVARTLSHTSVVALPWRAGGLTDSTAKPTAKSASKPQAKPALRALLPTWNPVRFGPETVKPDKGGQYLLLGGDDALFAWLRSAQIDVQRMPVAADASVEQIEALLSTQVFDHLLWFAPEVGDDDAASIISSQNTGVLSLFRTVKALTRLDWFERELKLTVVTCGTQQVFEDERMSPHHAGVHGMIGSIAKELPLWRIRLLDIMSVEDLDAQEILALPWDEQGNGLAYRCDEWFRQEFAEVSLIPTSNAAYKQNGVYVVIGGAGGLGDVWTRHMVANYDADVVWIGRRPLDADIDAKLDAVATIGRRPHYIAADVTDASALAAAADRIQTRFPKINGVVHSALVLQDQSVRAMDEAVFRQSLAAKVDVSVNIAQVFRDHELDFMLFFSSVSSFYRGAGQSNYCAGCTFKDSFAHSMRARHAYPLKIVNWGYWGSVGIVSDAFYRKRMESLGFGSIEPEEAMQALESFIASDMHQLALVKVISDSALDDLHVTEEIRYYGAVDGSNVYSGDSVVA